MPINARPPVRRQSASMNAPVNAPLVAAAHAPLAASLVLAEKAVPRYTSYPTAPHFHAGVTPEVAAGWLAALPPDARLSLYLHVPIAGRSAITAAATPRRPCVTRRSTPMSARF